VLGLIVGQAQRKDIDVEYSVDIEVPADAVVSALEYVFVFILKRTMKIGLNSQLLKFYVRVSQRLFCA